MVDLSALVLRIAELAARIAGKPDLRWATVTGTNPVEIQFDVEDTPLAGQPSTLVAGLSVGDRVMCVVSHRRVTIIGKGGGSGEIPEGATQAEVNAGAVTGKFVSPKTLRDRSYAPFAMAAGQASIGAAYTTVTFPAGRFTQPPRVVATPNLTTSPVLTAFVQRAAVTASSFSVALFTVAASSAFNSGGLDWVAVQMTSSSGSG